MKRSAAVIRVLSAPSAKGLAGWLCHLALLEPRGITNRLCGRESLTGTVHTLISLLLPCCTIGTSRIAPHAPAVSCTWCNMARIATDPASFARLDAPL